MRDERGVALAIAVFALVLIGALVAALSFAGTEEQRLTEHTRGVQQAFGRAEVGLAEMLDSLAGGGPRRAAMYAGQIHHLSESLYLLDVAGTDPGDRSRQRLGLLARVRTPAFHVPAALTSPGAVHLEGEAKIAGQDGSPEGWPDCAVPDGSIAPVGVDTVPFGGLDYAELLSHANHALPGGRYSPQPAVGPDGACNKSMATNWGDGVASGQPCSGHVPVVRIVGDLELGAGQGQGVLIVEGDLTIAGPFQFFGIVIVTGRILTPGWGGGAVRVWGAVIAGNPTAADQRLAGDIALTWSKCSVAKALRGLSVVEPLPSRAWIQLF